MTKKQKKALFRILLSIVLFCGAIAIPAQGHWKLVAFFPAYFLIGWDVLWKAIRNIVRGHIFDENFLMALATIGAFFVGEYPEAVVVMLFYQIGEWFQDYAVNQSRKSISELMNIRPDSAAVIRDGKMVVVDPETVAVGEFILVKAGEKIPLDGIVTDGFSLMDTSALTGESVPRDVTVGDSALSGCINVNGVLTIQVTKVFQESTVSKILDLVENASSKKAKSENFITKFAQYYTPFVVCSAVLLAVVPPLLLPNQVFAEWIHRALIFLVISCPCALVISVPLSFFGGIGGASKQGILVKGSNYLETLAHTETVVLDKTGTLTKGTFEVTEICPYGDAFSKEELLQITAYAENSSNHPVSLSIKKAYAQEIDRMRLTDAEEIAGYGVTAKVDGKKVIAGNEKWMNQLGISVPVVHSGTIVHVAVEKEYAGSIRIADTVKEESAQAIVALKKAGIRKTILLTGDKDIVGQEIAKQLQIDEVHTELLPADKVEWIETILGQKSAKGTVAFVGDGINDAPVLACADSGIAMGGIGSDAAIEAADIVIMDDNPAKIADAIAIAKQTLSIVKQNIVFALGIKLIVLILGGFGVATMWEAVFADVGVSVLAILNASRALRYHRK